MTHSYIACHLSPASGRLMLGTLHKSDLSLSEVARFRNVPVEDETSLYWNIPELYQNTLEGLRTLGASEEPVDSISCCSWGGDYLLFGSDGSLASPTYHSADPRTEEAMDRVFSKAPWEQVYNETGLQYSSTTTLSQLSVETSRRLRHAKYLLPVADGFNYLLCGLPRVEKSQASATQLFNPVTNEWSKALCHALRIPESLLPPVVPGGTLLGRLHPDLARLPGLEDTRVIAACSHEAAAALLCLPLGPSESWAFLHTGPWASMGARLPEPILTSLTRDSGFSNELSYDGSVFFQKTVMGMWMLNECRRSWEQKGCGLDDEMLVHLAGSAAPFESLLNPADPRFLERGDMPAKIQAFCKETLQPVPRKPGAIIRCVLESLAFLYRKALHELAEMTNTEFNRLYLVGEHHNRLLNHFIANALQIPVCVVPNTATALGSIMLQATTLGHVKSLADARQLARPCLKVEVIEPHASACLAAYQRLEQLIPC